MPPDGRRAHAAGGHRRRVELMLPDIVLALSASAAIVIGSPYIGQARAALQNALPGQYRAIVATVVISAIGVALIAAFARIRDRRGFRYLCLAAATIIGVAYARTTRTGNADQDLVEQFHFVEYGALTYLFYRVWRRKPDVAALVLPLCAAMIVGVLDEWFQWFIPSRVGELHDVLINAVAIGCGALVSVGVDPPASISLPNGRGRRVIVAGATASVIVVATFLQSVHLGYTIRNGAAAEFRSQFDTAALQMAIADRSERWRTAAPSVEQGIAREDHYLSEGQWHVQRRNEATSANDLWRAWNENLILETYFAPVLDLGSRWSPEMRAQAASSAAQSGYYSSDAEPYPIYVVSRSMFWSVIASLVAAIWAGLMMRQSPVSPVARV
jgi:hypothetical protein